jgi:hypothetical protein
MSFDGARLDAKHVTFVPRFTGFQLAVSVGTDLPDEFGQQDTVARLINTIFHAYSIGVQGKAPTSTAELTGVLWSNVNTPWQIGNFSLGLDYLGPAAFANESGGDYHLTAASAAIDRGVVTEVGIDFDGNPRNQGPPDLGAFEHTRQSFNKIQLPFVVNQPLQLATATATVVLPPPTATPTTVFSPLSDAAPGAPWRPAPAP